MNFQDRLLIHQIHPVKLAVDWITGATGLVLLWQKQLWPRVIVASVPAGLISLYILRFSDLTRYEQSRLGRALRTRMTPLVQSARLGGFFIAGLGAWWHSPILIVAGLLVILGAWWLVVAA